MPVRTAVFLMVFCLCMRSAHGEYIRATGKDELIFISNETEIRLGKSIARNAEEKYGIYPDVDLQKRIDTIGQKLAGVCDRPALTYSFRVLEGGDLPGEARINAFALPGGYVYIFKDMVDFLETDEAIAAVIAHELGHICSKDGIRKLQGSIGTLGLQAIAIASRPDRRTFGETQVAINELMMHYSREAETRADRLSVKYMKAAGYDPEAAVAFMNKMLEKKFGDPVRRYYYYRSHPYTSERIAILKREVHGTMDFEDYTAGRDLSYTHGHQNSRSACRLI